jgi:hypothetical protein
MRPQVDRLQSFSRYVQHDFVGVAFVITFAGDKHFGFVCVANRWRNTCTATGGGGESSSVIFTIYGIFHVCDPKVAKGVTHDPTVETAVVCDIYCKWFDTNAISWTLRSTDTYNE